MYAGTAEAAPLDDVDVVLRCGSFDRLTRLLRCSIRGEVHDGDGHTLCEYGHSFTPVLLSEADIFFGECELSNPRGDTGEVDEWVRACLALARRVAHVVSPLGSTLEVAHTEFARASEQATHSDAATDVAMNVCKRRLGVAALVQLERLLFGFWGRVQPGS